MTYVTCYWQPGYCETDAVCPIKKRTVDVTRLPSSLDPNAAGRFYRACRDFAANIKVWETALWHEILPDEEYDHTLISARLYGRRDEYLAVQAAVGIDAADQPLPVGRRVAFPTEGQLLSIKRRTGFESIAAFRSGGAPTWA